VRSAVHKATRELLVEQPPENVTFPAIAQRSGVHLTTIYRRWRTMSGLLDDVVVEMLQRASPVPDTGSLRGDLTAYALEAARVLSTPAGTVYVRAGAGSIAARETELSRPALQVRGQALQGMLDRAKERGEPSPTLNDLLEVVLAPMYSRVLLTADPPDEAMARRVVDRLLKLSTP